MTKGRPMTKLAFTIPEASPIQRARALFALPALRARRSDPAQGGTAHAHSSRRARSLHPQPSDASGIGRPAEKVGADGPSLKAVMISPPRPFGTTARRTSRCFPALWNHTTAGGRSSSRIVARRIPWPDLAAQPNRTGCACAGMPWPRTASFSPPRRKPAQRWRLCGLGPETLVTMRHEGAGMTASRRCPFGFPPRGARSAPRNARGLPSGSRGSQGKPVGRSALPEAAPDAGGLPRPIPQSRQSPGGAQ